MIFLFAFIGGLILNLMPCVLPVISVKILTLIKDKSITVKNIFLYVTGVLTSFLSLSLIVVIANLMGEKLGWGYHMQSPGFVVFLMYVFFLMGINLLGGYDIAFGSHKFKSSGMFLYGILTTLSSTPCLAPFLGSAIGLAMGSGHLMTILIFQAIGIGLAFPYIILGIFPKLVKKLPKAGNWNQNFKEILSFPLFITSIWLLWVAVNQTTQIMILFLPLSVLALYFVIWMSKKFSNLIFQYGSSCMIILIIVSSIFWVSYNTSSNIDHQIDNNTSNKVVFSENALKKLISNNKKVFVIVTADWCITCKINERLFLQDESFQSYLKENMITQMVADWTMRDDDITQYMASLNYSGVPMYVFYSGKENVVILPTLLTKNILLDTIK